MFPIRLARRVLATGAQLAVRFIKAVLRGKIEG